MLEVRQQYSFYGILLYIGATIFVIFNAITDPEARVWNGLFWVIQLFICINAVAKSFLQESKGRMRTAAYVVAINKVGTSYAELGIFP